MNVKRNLSNRIKGWIPREPNIQTHVLQQPYLKTEIRPLFTGLGVRLVVLGLGFCFFSSYYIDGNLPSAVVLDTISHYLMSIAVGCAFLILGVVLILFGMKKSQNIFSTTRQAVKNWIDGWIPKEPIRLSAQTSRTLSVFLIAIMAILIVPFFYLVIQATNYLGIFWPIIYLVIVLVSRYVINKTGFKTALPTQSQTIMLRVQRIRIAIASGLLTAFGIGFAARLIIGPLSAYFWIPFVILTIVGALIGDSIWKLFQKRSLEKDTK